MNVSGISIPAGSAANDRQGTIEFLNSSVATENDDASWALVAKYVGAAAGRAEFAQRIESAEQGVTGEGLGLSSSDFDAIRASATSAAAVSSDASPAAGAANSSIADQGTDSDAYPPLPSNSVPASTTATSDAASLATETAPTVSESEVAAADALRTLETITKSKAESQDILQSAEKLLDNYA